MVFFLHAYTTVRQIDAFLFILAPLLSACYNSFAINTIEERTWMKVWVVRHGESETNRDGLWTGWLDVELTEKGREDAAKAGKILAGTSFDKI